jgi:hypothetical protein
LFLVFKVTPLHEVVACVGFVVIVEAFLRAALTCSVVMWRSCVLPRGSPTFCDAYVVMTVELSPLLRSAQKERASAQRKQAQFVVNFYSASNLSIRANRHPNLIASRGPTFGHSQVLPPNVID